MAEAGKKSFPQVARHEFSNGPTRQSQQRGHPLRAFHNDRWGFKTGFTITLYRNALLGIRHANAC